ncbi:hypothetical protein [Anatilimnocola floriformis]|uniref:hypothetical protein n=1 Tax=Anatilimnocola floriformis TaxID=2948575 RepID=UPI0020C5127B|nr:hypothetical protein [Anatilimnocola floriformis]
MTEIVGSFEIHFTLAAVTEPSALQATAERMGMKWLWIELERGANRSQPMLTARARGSLPQVMSNVRIETSTLAEAGLSVVRVKIEAEPTAQGIPQTCAAAIREPADRYFEFHLKLLLAEGTDLRSLKEFTQPHGAHLSRNARRRRDDGLEERFITQRCSTMGQIEARAAWQQLLQDLQRAEYELLEAEEEYVVYDSNLALDAGWLSKE